MSLNLNSMSFALAYLRSQADMLEDKSNLPCVVNFSAGSLCAASSLSSIGVVVVSTKRVVIAEGVSSGPLYFKFEVSCMEGFLDSSRNR